MLVGPGTMRTLMPHPNRPLLILAVVALLGGGLPARASAPHDGDRFMNPGGERSWPSIGVSIPFFARKIWTSVVGRDGGALRVAYDPVALQENPSITWIGHSTMLVRMAGMVFLTDPMFSHYATPVPMLGPGRLVEPGDEPRAALRERLDRRQVRVIVVIV